MYNKIHLFVFIYFIHTSSSSCYGRGFHYFFELFVLYEIAVFSGFLHYNVNNIYNNVNNVL
jgi:hypothetical protein